MASLTYATPGKSLPVTAFSNVTLPIALSDMTTPLAAAGVPVTPGMQAAMTNIVNQQSIMTGMLTSDPDYTGRLAMIQVALRGLGLYPAGASTGPSPVLGY